MLHKVICKFKGNSFVKDSFWAVFGNGIGNFLLLMAGIFIARFLGKDIYGEYGMVKTTMFHIAAFSSFGLSYTSTKIIAEYKNKDSSYLRSIVVTAINITFVFSLMLSILMFFCANVLADIVHAPQLKLAFRFLSIIIVFRALSSVCAGLLAGFKYFKDLGINNVISGMVMFFFTIPFTYLYGLYGSLLSLCISQVLLVILNIYKVYKIVICLKNQNNTNIYKKMFVFSIPIELQELSYIVSTWGASLLITRYASLGDLGIYTACAQWYAIVIFLPGLLQNVVLSYLSEYVENKIIHLNMLRQMLQVNFICAIVPLGIVLLASPLITSFYGETFDGMHSVLIILLLATIPVVLSNVYVANLLANSRIWILSFLRVSRDILSIVSLYLILIYTKGENAAYNYAVLSVVVAILFLGGLLRATQAYK